MNQRNEESRPPQHRDQRQLQGDIPPTAINGERKQTGRNGGPFGRNTGQYLYQVNRLAVGTVLPRAVVQVMTPDGNWTNIKAILDSGSGTTCGSLQHHRKLFKTTRPVTNVVKLQLVNREQYIAKEYGRLDTRVIDVEQKVYNFKKPIMVFLVDAPQWEELIIGYPTLRNEGLLPEQNLKKSQEQN